MPAGQEGKPLKGVRVEGRRQPAGIRDKGFQTEGTAEQRPRGRTPAVGLTRVAAAAAWDTGAEAGEEMKLEGEKGPVDGYVEE